MSLTTRLARGELARWWDRTGTGVRNLAGDVNRRLHAAGSPAPIPSSAADQTEVDGAFAQRVGLLIEGSAPTAALLGPMAVGLASPGWPDAVAEQFGPSRLPAAVTSRFSPYRRQVSHPHAPASDVAEHERVLDDFTGRTARFLAEHAPPGSLGNLGAERGLARICWVLGGWEQAYRTGRLPERLAAVHGHLGYTAADLRDAVPEPIVAELVDLVRVLHTSRTLASWRGDSPGRPIVTGPLGIAAPVILPGWAEGDVLIGSTLWKITTTTRPDAENTMYRLLWRLLACAWLDTRDVYGIRSVGIYLARRGVAVSWSLTAFASSMLGGTGREDAARTRFLELAGRLARADGAEPPPPWMPRTKVLYGR